MRPVLATLLLSSVFVACASTLPHPTDQTAAALGVSRADLEQGREKYVDRCSSCHALFQPHEFPASKWHEMVSEMAPRAKLLPRDREVILHYLVAFARKD